MGLIFVVLIWTPPSAELLRATIRSTLPTLTNMANTAVCALRVRLVVRFAVGLPRGAHRQGRLLVEQATHHDLALSPYPSPNSIFCWCSVVLLLVVLFVIFPVYLSCCSCGCSC